MSHGISKQYGEWGIKLKAEKNDYQEPFLANTNLVQQV